MKFHLTLIIVAISSLLAEGREILSSYNLIASQGAIVSQPSFHGLVTPGIIASSEPEHNLAHPAVVENAIAESQLPQELLNPFYKNPVIAAGLAKESWFTNKEFPVHNRVAETIPRSEIAKIINRIHHAQSRRR